jgi:outer membrane murein-binding lipoprotein Lpp
VTGRRVRLAAAVLGGLLLAGCSADPAGELRKEVRDLTEAANDRDAEQVRDEVDDLLAEIEDAVRSGELTSAEGARLAQLATAVRDAAVQLEPAEEPTPSPTTASPTPSPTPSPTRSPTPTRTPSATPSPTETEEPEPEPTGDPTDEPTAEPTDDGGIIPDLPG